MLTATDLTELERILDLVIDHLTAPGVMDPKLLYEARFTVSTEVDVGSAGANPENF